jgi:hypothetical protein
MRRKAVVGIRGCDNHNQIRRCFLTQSSFISMHSISAVSVFRREGAYLLASQSQNTRPPQILYIASLTLGLSRHQHNNYHALF